MNFKDYKIEEFLEELKIDIPSPGGGSVAALVSALASSLNSMVYSFTVNKKSFDKLDEENKTQMIEFKDKSDRFISESVMFMEEDRRTFMELMDTFKLPKESEKDKKYRNEEIRKKTINAMECPLNLAKKAIDFYDNIDFAVEFGNQNLISDAVVAAILIHSAIESAVVNVLINFNSLRNKEGYENIKEQCSILIEESLKRKNKITNLFGI